MSAWHPVRCLSRTDGEVGSLYHSFYLVNVDLESDEKIKIAMSLPSSQEKEFRRIKEGLQFPIIVAARELYAQETRGEHYTSDEANVDSKDTLRSTSNLQVCNGEQQDNFGTFVLKLENGHRYFCSWRGNSSRMFVAVSTFPFSCNTRTVLELIGMEKSENVFKTLLTLCESPILPACGLRYDLGFSEGRSVSVNFSSVEQVDDIEVFRTATMIFHPAMIIAAWESIVSERGILVRSSNPALLPPCCEFLRRLALPLVLDNYVPVLAEEQVDFVECPGSYIFGIDSELLEKNMWRDIGQVVIVDLDTRHVTFSDDSFGFRAPTGMVSRLLKKLNDIYLTDIVSMLNRPFNSSRDVLSAQSARISNDETVLKKANSILDVFINENISLLSARHCFLPNAFIRKPASLRGRENITNKVKDKRDLGFEIVNGIVCGFLQLLDDSGRIPVWVEASDMFIDVYQYADQLPRVIMGYKDINSVSPSSLEPEGHIFELLLKSQITLRFQVANTDARYKWITLIDKYLDRLNIPNNVPVQTADQSNFGGTNVENLLLPVSSQSAPTTDEQDSLMNDNGDNESILNERHLIAQMDDEEKGITGFRSQFLTTQMLDNLESKLDSVPFDLYLHKFGLTYEESFAVETAILDMKEKYIAIREGPSITNLLKTLTDNFKSGKLGTTKNSDSSKFTIQDEEINAKTKKLSLDRMEVNDSSNKNDDDTKEDVPKKSSIFKKIFNRPPTSAELPNVPEPREKTILEQEDSKIEETIRIETRQILSQIVMSYRLCSSEIRNGIVDDRINILAALVDLYHETNSGVTSNQESTITINVSEECDRGQNAKPSQNDSKCWLDFMWSSLQKKFIFEGEDGKINQEEQMKESYKIKENFLHHIQQQIEMQNLSDKKRLMPVLQTLLGHLYSELERPDEAISAFAIGKFISEASITECLSRKFVDLVKSRKFSPPEFLTWAMDQSMNVALHAYRLIMHLIYRRVSKKFSHMTDEPLDDSLILDSKISGIFGATKLEPKNVFGMRGGKVGENTGRHDSPDSAFTWVENKGTISPNSLNESVICKESSTAAKPVQLSIYLATKVRDLISAYIKSPTGSVHVIKSNGHDKVDLQAARLKDIKHTSAYQNFELQVCELQRVDLNTLRTSNELSLFFVNVYNTLMLHAIIDLGSPGLSMLERNKFCQTSYKIGDMQFSIFNIEHGILRYKSTKANIFGFQVSSITDRDPRSSFRLHESMPYISFVLFTAMEGSPPMVVLHDPENLEEELTMHAKEWVRMYVRARRENYTVIVPQLLKVYYDDFAQPTKPGAKKQKGHFIKLLINLAPDMLRSELHAIFFSGKTSGHIAKPQLFFDTMNWYPYIIL